MDCHRISVPTPFAVGRVNCYLLDGEEPTLVDPGPASEAAREALVAGLADHGYDLADVDRLVVTHPHMDHYGLAAAVVRAAGATVCAHPDAVAWLADPDGQLQREQALFEPFMREMGVPDALAGTVVSLPDTYREFREPVEVGRDLREGDRLTAGGADLEVLHTPGHAPGSVCLLAAGEAVFTGDHLLADVSPNPLLTTRPDDPDERTRSLPQYLEALERLRGVDAPVAHPGHGDRIEDVDGRIEEVIAHHRDREQRVADLLADGPLTAYEVMEALFPDLPATEIFPGMSEAIGHLDLLEEAGRVETVETDGVVAYRLV